MDLSKSKTIIYLKSLQTTELNGFREYCEQKSQNSKAFYLLELLLPSYPEFEDLELTGISKKLFGGKKLKEQQLRNALTETNQLIERYFISMHLEKDPLLQSKFLTEELVNRGLHKFYKQEENYLRENIRNSTVADHKQLQFNFEADRLWLKDAGDHDPSGVSEALQKTNQSLDELYLAQKLKYTTELINHNLFFHTHPDTGLLNYWINNFQEEKYKHQPAISSYFQLYHLLSSQDEKQFEKTKKEIIKNAKYFTLPEQRDLYGLLQNFCIFKLNKGHSGFLSELFELYVLMSDKKLLINNDLLEEQHFKNIVAIGLRLQKFSWVKKFMQENYKFLKEELRENALHYNMARLYYAIKKYKEALKTLQNVTFTNTAYHLDSRVLMLKIYFDSSQSEALESLLFSFKQYVQRNKAISKSQREVYFNFVKYLRRIFLISEGGKGNSEQLKQEISVCTAIVDKDWLLARC